MDTKEVTEHRCIRGWAWNLNPNEGSAYIRVPVRVGDPEPETDEEEYTIDDWVWGYRFCPQCGAPVSSPVKSQRWLDAEPGQVED